MVAVALLQGAAFIALVNGLAVRFTKDPPLPNPEGQQITMPLPPPPILPDGPKDDVKPTRDRDIPQTRTTIDDGQDRYRPPETPAGPTGNTGQTSGQTTIADPVPQPPPPLPPAGARPMGRSGDWVTTNDYPARDLREGNQGITGFRLTIGTDGRVQACTVTRSSGFRGLDDATCRNLTRRARFKPATDGNGTPVVGEYANNIRWVIPD